jgi:hypothetical protein
MTFDQAFKLTSSITGALMQSGMNKEVAETMASKATEDIGGDDQKSMGLDNAGEQADQLKAQDAEFGKAGAESTAGALNSNTADPTPASAAGLTTRYKMLGAESDTPFTQAQTDDLRMGKVADIYAKHGLLDKSMALKDKLTASQRQRTSDEREAKRFARDEKGWVAADAEATRAAAVKGGIAEAFKGQREAEAGSAAAGQYQTDIAGVVEGKGIEATIRASAGPDATKDEIDAAVEAYRQSIGDATAQHNAAGMDTMYKQMASVYGEIGQDPEKALKFVKMAEAEGVPKLIEAAKAGNVDAMNKLWNSSGHGRGIVKSIGQDKKGGDLYAVVIDPYTGKRIGANGFVNITAMEKAMMSATDIAKLRETESKIGENEAQAASAYANADQSRAGAGKARAETSQVNAETKILTETGEKPAAGGGKGYKTEAAEVSAALGTPVLNRRGVPETDANGKPLYSRNADEERAFYKWMKANKIKDTNEGLSRWMAGEKPAAPAKARPAAPFDPKAFMR